MEQQNDHSQSQDHSMHMSWWRFAAMILTSVGVMFVLMYQLVYRQEHVFFSLNRLVSSLLMGAVMACIMLAFMWSMYGGAKTKWTVLMASTLTALALLWVNRGQVLIDDSRFMQSMIPHHSIAINNARKAKISDPRVRELADKIIESQLREIEEMKLLLDDFPKNGKRGESPLPPRSAEVDERIRFEARKVLE